MRSPNPVLLECERFQVVRRKQVDDAGRERTREVILHPGSVVILPLLAEDHVCLINNYRVSVERTLLELPAGTLDPGEDPLAAAGRELKEETGYTAGRLELLHSFYPAPGILAEQMHLFVATDLTPGDAERETGEWIENVVLPWSAAMDKVAAGEIVDGKTMLGLLLHQQLRSASQ